MRNNNSTVNKKKKLLNPNSFFVHEQFKAKSNGVEKSWEYRADHPLPTQPT